MSYSRLDISGPIDQNTPFVVLIELYEAFGGDSKDLSPDQAPKLLRTVQRITPPTVSKDCRDFRQMARFVNPRVTWTAGVLRKAFKFLLKPSLSRDFRPGLQTPADPYTINGCLLYRYCKELNIPVNVRTTLDEMANLVRLTKFPPPDLELYLSSRLADLPLSVLAELTVKVGLPNRLTGPVSYPLVDQPPTNDDQAIAQAAYLYSVDISDSICPITAYQLVRDNPELFTSPDPRTHPQPYPCLNYQFNPNLPIDYYSNNTLSSLLAQEGLTATNRQDDYQQLQRVAKTITFRLTGSATHTSIMMEDVTKFEFGQVVYLGAAAFSLDELCQTFKTYGQLINPSSDNQALLTADQVTKLKTICRNYPSDQSRALLAQIQEVEQILACSCRQQTDFIRDYHKLSPELKSLVIRVFQAIHDLAMYMRGWDGVGPLPVTKAPVDDQLQVDLNVTQAMITLDQLTHQLPEQLQRRIMDLNLYCQREDGLRVSSPQDTVPTLGLRLALVRGGTDLETIESCIRVSSNYLAATAYVYLRSLGHRPDYDLTTLRYIS